MKYALIGCGRIGHRHICAAKDISCEIVALCDVDIDNARQYKEQYKLSSEIYNDYCVMIKEKEIDIIAIATPSGTHYEIAAYFLKKGINVILEKPMGMSISQCKKLKNLTLKHKVLLIVCHQNRYNKAVVFTMDTVKNLRIGEVYYISAQIRWNRDKEYYASSPWRGKWSTDGGVLLNQGIHTVEIVSALSGGKVKSVIGKVDNFKHKYIETEDSGYGIITYDNGVRAIIEGTTNAYDINMEETVTIFGEKGTIKLGGQSLNKLEYWSVCGDNRIAQQINEYVEEPCNDVYGMGHTALYKDINEYFISGREPYINIETATQSVKTVLGIYRSAHTGKEVNFPCDDIYSGEFIDLFTH